MKKVNLYFVALLGLTMFTYCSSDDNDVLNNFDKILIKVKQKTYSQEGELQEVIIFIYEDNKPKIDSFYNANNELTYYSKWLYSENGLLSSTKGYLPNGTLNTESNLTYDNSNRITQNKRSEENGTYITTTSFVYNSDNTISSEQISDGYTTNKMFYLNNLGIINKEQRENYVVNVIYDDNENAISKTTTYNTINFIYDNNLFAKSPLGNSKSIFGSYKNNFVIWQNSLDDGVTSYGNKLLIRLENSNGSIIKYNYVFDDNNYPIKQSFLANDVLVSEIEFIYE